MNRTADLRESVKTLEDAKRLMAEIARLECNLACAAAQFEKRVVAAKQAYTDRASNTMDARDTAVQQLTMFIQDNKDLFLDPRKVATEFGAFGLQEASEVEITNEQDVIGHCIDAGYEDCVKTVRALLKQGLKAHLKSGEKIPGCHLKEGDTVVYKVARQLLDEAREKAQ